MTPGVRRTNRTIAVVLGVLLIALGVAIVAWWSGNLSQVWAAAPDSVDVTRVSDATTAGWWTAVAAIAGVVLIGLGLAWLLVHLRTTRVGRTTLPGSDASGHLALELSGVARHFASLVGEQNGVSSAKADFVMERGRTVLRSTIDVDPEANLANVCAAISTLTAQARDVAGIRRFAAQTRLHVNRRRRRLERVS